MARNHVFIILTNKHSNEIIELYKDLLFSTDQFGEVFIVYHKSTANIPDEIKDLKHHFFTDDIFTQLNYTPIADGLIPGSCHFPLLDFYLKHPNFDYYWFIEDDVRFNGSWQTLFKIHSKSLGNVDFAACHIRHYDEEPDWYWWDTLSHPYKFIPKNLRLRSFNPFFRISNSALKFIHYAQRNHWQGHNEVLFPTLLFLEGFTIQDFGGVGSFVPNKKKNLLYVDAESNKYGELTSGTMRYRPVFLSCDLINNKLCHPVKLI